MEIKPEYYRTAAGDVIDAIEDLTKARTYIARLIEMETTANGKV